MNGVLQPRLHLRLVERDPRGTTMTDLLLLAMTAGLVLSTLALAKLFQRI